MRVVVQRVKSASVTQVETGETNSISHGLLCYVGMHGSDSGKDVRYIADKLVNLRIFPDNKGIMNESVLDHEGEILCISQFTLMADVRKGRRPSYNNASDPEPAKKLYEELIMAINEYLPCKPGFFQQHMHVESINDGPVTILIDSHKEF
jgi:D-tyrosyl-tRNA(Tyr) deacylase